MILTPAQALIAKDTHRFRVINSGRRFGKTTLAVWEMFGKAVAQDNRRVAYIAPTFQQARDICWQELKRICQPVALSINESRLEIKVKTQHNGESIIWLRGWEAVETLRGQRFDFIVIDEVAMMRNFWVNWQEVISPTLTDTRGEVMFISTPKGFNHFYDLHNKQDKDPDFKSFHFTSYDNPFIPREEIDRQKESLNEDAFAQEFLADFRKQQGLVYKEFDRERHTYEKEVTHVVERLGAVDFGFTNPCAVLTVLRDHDDNYFVEDELYRRGMTDAQAADYVAACRFNAVYPDPENPAAIQELVNRGVNIREVIKGKDSITNGISKVRNLLRANKLFIHKRCENLLWEFETYSYPDKKPEHNEPELPLKENDHALDALRYVISMNKPEDKLTPTEMRERLLMRQRNLNNQAR